MFFRKPDECHPLLRQAVVSPSYNSCEDAKALDQPANKPVTYLDALPSDLLPLIFAFLTDIKDKQTFAQICQKARNVANLPTYYLPASTPAPSASIVEFKLCTLAEIAQEEGLLRQRKEILDSEIKRNKKLDCAAEPVKFCSTCGIVCGGICTILILTAGDSWGIPAWTASLSGAAIIVSLVLLCMLTEKFSQVSDNLFKGKRDFAKTTQEHTLLNDKNASSFQFNMK